MAVTTEHARWSFCRSPSGPLERLSTEQVEHLTLSDNDLDDIPSGLPAEVHVELLRLGRIPDPFLKDNEKAVQWIGETSWIFRGVFDKLGNPRHKIELVLDRVDTFAAVWLNGVLVHENDNGLHCDQRIDISHLNTASSKLVLLIQFYSPVLKARELMQKNAFKATVWNGENARAYARKLQYHFGWDWGHVILMASFAPIDVFRRPTLVTCGVQGSVTIQTYDSRLIEFYPRLQLGEDFTTAELLVDARIEGKRQPGIKAFLRVTDPDGKTLGDELSLSTNRWQHRLHIKSPHLWWPANLGGQPLYTIELQIVLSNGRVVDSRKLRVGARQFRVVQEPLKDSPGTTFYFEINGVAIFAGGSNWIPLDSFLSRTTKVRLRRWLELARDGNQNTLRVWGGGTYENDFYDLCDEFGLLIWQDFPFACGLYPADEAFCANVAGEARANLLRIRHHPSLVVLAGNNEDYQVAESLGHYRSTDDFDATKFPAKHIYEKVLPEMVREICGGSQHYFPSSPWNGGDTRDPHRGDNHQWQVWHGDELPYQSWHHLTGRFISEWGMQSFPHRRTIEHWLDGELGQAEPHSRLVQHHQKAEGGQRRLDNYIESNFKTPRNLDDYIFVSQLMQSECISMGVQTWRRGFKGPGRYECAGSLVWQLNDCWPVISWAIVDYLERPKAAYYSMKRALAPLSLGTRRHADKSRASSQIYASIWISNISRQTVGPVVACTEIIDIASGDFCETQEHDIKTIPAMSCYEMEKIALTSSPQQRVISIRLCDKGGRVLARTADWPQPLKAITFSSLERAEVNLAMTAEGRSMRVSTSRPLKGLTFTTPDRVKLADNAIDLMPHDPQTIAFTGNLLLDQLSWRCLE